MINQDEIRDDMLPIWNINQSHE